MSKARKITQAEAKAFVQSLGMTFRKTAWGEFRVAYAHPVVPSNEDSAYYTDDIEDAVDTAYAMYTWRANNCNGVPSEEVGRRGWTREGIICSGSVN